MNEAKPPAVADISVFFTTSVPGYAGLPVLYPAVNRNSFPAGTSPTHLHPSSTSEPPVYLHDLFTFRCKFIPNNRYKRLSAKIQSFFLGSDTNSACPRLLRYVVQDMQCNNFCCGYD